MFPVFDTMPLYVVLYVCRHVHCDFNKKSTSCHDNASADCTVEFDLRLVNIACMLINGELAFRKLECKSILDLVRTKTTE